VISLYCYQDYMENLPEHVDLDDIK
jgi:hypothetical protein